MVRAGLNGIRVPRDVEISARGGAIADYFLDRGVTLHTISNMIAAYESSLRISPLR
jgi:hypothetical protein